MWYWTNYDPMKLATIEAFYENPRLVWDGIMNEW